MESKKCSNCGAVLTACDDGGARLVLGMASGFNLAPIWQRQDFGPSQKELFDANTCPCCDQQTLVASPHA